MNDRERLLYVIVPLLWLIFLGATLGLAIVRHQPADAGGDATGQMLAPPGGVTPLHGPGPVALLIVAGPHGAST
jgi:hypothetical protein